jgi:aminopeptidase
MQIAVEQAQIERYAEVLLKVGVNLQPGQTVVIRGAGAEVAPFVHAITRQAYASGAAYVHVLWADHEIMRLGILHASEEQLRTYPSWESAWLMELVAQDAVFIMLDAPDHGAFKGLDPHRLTLRNHAALRSLRPIREQFMAGSVRWLVAALPTASWATQVFPDLPSELALDRLWDLICRATRLDTGDPIAAWTTHLAHLSARRAFLEQAHLHSLHYQGPGTDLTVELLLESKWTCGATSSTRGVSFVPNMPTDEVFTVPRRTGTNGTVRCTRPLYFNGVLIENIALRFEHGKIVETTASGGIEVLNGALDTDKGARYLGEVALVPVDSAVASLRTVFFNTLFDENASCHLAFGSGLPLGIHGGETKTADELLAMGVNQSAIHVDLMVGSEDLDIDGTTASGDMVPLLRRGQWVFSSAQPIPN